MKTRYKIILIAVCAYFGVFLGPVTASNVYCDFISQEFCTSRITGVVLPPLNLIMPSLPSDDCLVNNDGVMEPCYNEAGLLEWPFPPRMEEHSEQNCDEICLESNAEHSEMAGMSWISYGYEWILKIIVIILILITIPIGIIFSVKIWRKRK